jgi:hypothetical protein
MNVPEPDPKAYSLAIEMLKRRNLRLKWARAGGLVVIGVLLLAGEVRVAGAAALALGGALLLMRDPLSANRFQAAEKFILTDDQERVRAVLGMDKGYTTLRYFTESGQVVLDLSGSSDHSAILLAPEAGGGHALLQFEAKWGPALTLKNSWGEVSVMAFGLPGAPEHLGAEWAPGAHISVKDASGRRRVVLEAESGDLGATRLNLTSGTGDAQISFRVDGEKTYLKLREHDVSRTL